MHPSLLNSLQLAKSHQVHSMAQHGLQDAEEDQEGFDLALGDQLMESLPLLVQLCDGHEEGHEGAVHAGELRMLASSLIGMDCVIH